MTDDIEKVFASLRPLCVEIAKNPFNYDSLGRLKSEILKSSKCDPETWRCLFDYVVFPLRLLLRRSSPVLFSKVDGTGAERKEKVENCLITIFDIFRILIGRCGGEFNRPDVVVSLLSESFLLICNPPGSETVTENNRLIIAVTDFAPLLSNFCPVDENRSPITISGSDVDQKIMKKKLLENRPVLAQVVHALLGCLKKSGATRTDDDETRNLQISIVRCLSGFLSLDDELSAAFLPGVASVLADFIISLCTNVVSSRGKFIAECLELWKKVVTAANTASSSSSVTAGNNESTESGAASATVVATSDRSGPSGSAPYTEEWRRNAALQLGNVWERLSSTLISHPSANVRRTLFDTALRFLGPDRGGDSILCDCWKRCLEIVAACVADDHLRIDVASVLDLRREYGDLLEKMLLSTCWRLPRSSESPLSTEQRVDWRCLLGYLRILGPDGVSNFLLVDDHKETFFSGLLKSLELADVTEETKPAEELPEEELRVKTTRSSTFRRRIRLIRPSDSVAQELVLSACELLAKQDDLDSLYDYCYQLCSRSGAGRLPAMFVVNSVFAARRSPATWDLLFSFVDLYLANLRNASSLSAVEACLNLEGLGHCAACLRSDFQPSLIEAFYVVLALLRFPDYKDYVWAALFDFAAALDHETVLEMIVSNSDYLSSSLTLRLRRFTLYPDSASVLASLLDIVPVEAISAFRGTISETLKAIDHFASYPERRTSIASLLKVLERFCAFVAEKKPVSEKSKPVSVDEDEKEEKSAPWYIGSVVDILQRIRSWIFAEGIPTRLASLRVLELGLKALAHRDDSLLPLIHQTWPSTLARFSDVLENERDERMIVVSTAAFHTIVTMAAVSRAFVCRRIGEEAWPKTRRILQRYLPVSKRANALVYGQSPSFRLQLAILTSMGELCENIGASPEFLKEAADSCQMYDSKEVLPALRKAAAASLDRIGHLLNRDIDDSDV